MGMTMTEKILAAHAGLPCVKAGDLIEAKLDLVLGNDITTPVAITTFEAAGLTKIFDQDKIAIVLDHYTPCKDIKSAELCAQARAFAKKHGITHLYDVGEAGIEHALLPEKGLVAPGDCVIGADSHTCTYGALGAFSTGVGSTDMAAGMAIGENWFKVPAAIKVTLTGKLRPYVSGKDVILHLIGKIGVDGALYQSLEFTGEGVASLSMDDRFTIANMAIEAGAKNGIFPVDEKTVEYVSGRVNRPYTVYEADADARYAREVVIDLSSLAPTVSLPHAAEILSGRHIAPGVRCIVIPATQEIYLQCIREGLAETFLQAGCALSTPTCGPCLGGHMGVMSAGERAVSTTNRNFVGRMGHVKSEVVLASPAVAAASAVAGCLADPAELMKGV